VHEHSQVFFFFPFSPPPLFFLTGETGAPRDSSIEVLSPALIQAFFPPSPLPPVCCRTPRPPEKRMSRISDRTVGLPSTYAHQTSPLFFFPPPPFFLPLPRWLKIDAIARPETMIHKPPRPKIEKATFVPIAPLFFPFSPFSSPGCPTRSIGGADVGGRDPRTTTFIRVSPPYPSPPSFFCQGSGLMILTGFGFGGRRALSGARVRELDRQTPFFFFFLLPLPPLFPRCTPPEPNKSVYKDRSRPMRDSVMFVEGADHSKDTTCRAMYFGDTGTFFPLFFFPSFFVGRAV